MLQLLCGFSMFKGPLMVYKKANITCCLLFFQEVTPLASNGSCMHMYMYLPICCLVMVATLLAVTYTVGIRLISSMHQPWDDNWMLFQ